MKTLLCISTVFFVLFIVFTVAMFWEDPYVPKEGVWYCEELQIQISFEENNDTYVTEDGNQIMCTWSHDRNSKHFEVWCIDFNTHFYEYDDVVFSGTFVKLTNDQYILEDEAGKEYIFLRMDDQLSFKYVHQNLG